MKKNEYEKLDLLISQGQFELLPDEDSDNIRLVYLMNDAVESFLVFHDAELTGSYQSDFQGELWASLEKSGDRYVLIVHQDDTVCTLFFKDLTLEVHLFNYGKTGHFWVKGYEYLRQLEYRIAILRDKREYLGEDFCSEEEMQLSYLTEFPPLNFCCYPAVPDQYLVPSYPWWQVSGEALDVMKDLAGEAGDQSLKWWLILYAWLPWKIIAKQIARLLHTVRHAGVVDLIDAKLSHAAAAYEERVFAVAEEEKIQTIKEIAALRKKELERSGKRVEMLKEEPFLYAKDSVEYKIHLMIWQTEGKNRKVDVETFG
ncbi:MAG: DUF3878 family protein [Coprococcus sp.]